MSGGGIDNPLREIAGYVLSALVGALATLAVMKGAEHERRSRRPRGFGETKTDGREPE